jgi:8-oxo-dGTP pyrophosphatase MutT (NUDIX family)
MPRQDAAAGQGCLPMPLSDPQDYFVSIVESLPMSAPLDVTGASALNLYSANDFSERARLYGYPLEKAVWMARQPLSYGVDAGIRVDESGNTNEKLRLEHLVSGGTWKMAAVLVPVIAREPEATVLLTLRTSHLNTHGGQVAFPGGKIEATDATPVDAAIREAGEEVGIPPALITPLSLLDLHNTGTGFRIIPVLALVDPAVAPVPDPGEVAEVFEVPLSFLMAKENHVQHLRAWKEWRVRFYAMEYEKRFIWGATAAILRNLYERLYAADAE